MLIHKTNAAVQLIPFMYRDKNHCASDCLLHCDALLEGVTRDRLARQGVKTMFPDRTQRSRPTQGIRGRRAGFEAVNPVRLKNRFHVSLLA